MKIDLQIGGYRIRLIEPLDHACSYWPQYPFHAFQLDTDGQADVELRVEILEELPDIPHRQQQFFDASHGLWRLYESSSGYVMEIDSPQSLAPVTRAIISEDFSNVQAWSLGHRTPEGRLTWEPLELITPLGDVCLLTRLGRDGGILLHAAGVIRDGQAKVFTGASGTGKSTLTDFFSARGAQVLSDERTIIRRMAGKYVACGTPWVGSNGVGANEIGILKWLYCIRHGAQRHTLGRLLPRDVILFLLRQCFLPHWDRTAMDHTLSFLEELVTNIECRELAFLKNSDVVDYLETQSLDLPVASR